MAVMGRESYSARQEGGGTVSDRVFWEVPEDEEDPDDLPGWPGTGDRDDGDECDDDPD
jgi:hypothetical protein